MRVPMSGWGVKWDLVVTLDAIVSPSPVLDFATSAR